MAIKPLGPEEAKRFIPDFVIEAVNQLITEKCANQFQIKLKDIKSRVKTITEASIEDSMFDFEPLYREAGWVVEFDSPAYCENYDAYFTFTKPTQAQRR